MGPREATATRSDVATATSIWRARLRVTTYDLYRFLQQGEPVAPPFPIEAFAGLIDEGRALPSAPPTLTRVTAEALGGAIFHELCFAAAAEGPPPESDLIPMLMYTAVL